MKRYLASQYVKFWAKYVKSNNCWKSALLDNNWSVANQDCNCHRMQNVWIGTHISAKLLVTKHRSIHYVWTSDHPSTVYVYFISVKGWFIMYCTVYVMFLSLQMFSVFLKQRSRVLQLEVAHPVFMGNRVFNGEQMMKAPSWLLYLN